MPRSTNSYQESASKGLYEYNKKYGSSYKSPASSRAESISSGHIQDEDLLRIFFSKYKKKDSSKAPLSIAWNMWGGDSMKSHLLSKNPMKKKSTLDIDYISPEKISRTSSKTKKAEDLVSAKDQSSKYIDTFECPTSRDLRKVSPGDYVKLSVPGHRFWVKVTGFEGKKIQGYISNSIKYNNLSEQDNIYFYSKHIYDIIKKD